MEKNRADVIICGTNYVLSSEATRARNASRISLRWWMKSSEQ